MVGGSFINRETELAAFTRELSTADPDRNYIILLTGPTGFGKSQLADKFLQEQRVAPHIKVRIPANALGDGHFIRMLAAELDLRGRLVGDILTGAKFMRTLPSEGLRKSHDHHLLRDLSFAAGPLGSAVARISDRLSGTGDYNFEEFLRETDRPSTLRLFDYANHVFETTRLCLGVENVQAIDAGSEILLREILTPQRGHFTVFEYTTGVAAGRDLDALARIFRATGGHVKVVALERLSLDEIFRRTSSGSLDPETLRDIYFQFDGNLRRLEDLFVLRFRPGSSSIATEGPSLVEATRTRIAHLKPVSQFVLALVVTHRSRVTIEALRSLYEHSEYFRDIYADIDLAVRELEEADFLVRSGIVLSVAHDSVAEEVTLGFAKFVEAACRAWARYYRQKLDTQDFSDFGHGQALDFLFEFYLRTDPSKLQPLLSQVRQFALTSLTTDRARSILVGIDESLGSHEVAQGYEQQVRWTLLDTYYTAGLYQEALATFGRLRTLPMRRALYRAALLERLDRQAEALEAITKAFADFGGVNPSFDLSLLLLQMVCHRSLNEYQHCEAISRAIEAEPRYANLPEYGYYLRNAEIVMQVVDSLPRLQESVSIFRTHDMAACEAQSRISLGMQLIRLGRLDDAAVEYDRASSLLSDRRLEWHAIFNNLAVLQMYRDSPDFRHADRTLLRALLTANTTFDKIAINNNRLAAHALSGDFDFCRNAAPQLIEELRNQPDEVLCCITYYNISVYWEMSGNASQATRFRAAAGRFRSDWPEYWNYRLGGAAIDNDPAAAFLAKYPFDLVLLSAWHFEISDFGEQ